MVKNCRICGEPCNSGVTVANDVTLISALIDRITPKGADTWVAGDIVHREHFLNSNNQFRVRTTKNRTLTEAWFDEEVGLNMVDIAGTRVGATDRSRRAISRRQSLDDNDDAPSAS